MKIQVLGPGCKRSRTLLARVREVVGEMRLTARVEEVTDPEEIARRGVLTTPGLVVDGRVLASGRILSVKEIRQVLETAGS